MTKNINFFKILDDGDVWSWGYGGRSTNFLVDLLFSCILFLILYKTRFIYLFQATGALGHGENNHKYTPTPIQALRNTPPIKIITTGYRFALAINGIIRKNILN